MSSDTPTTAALYAQQVRAQLTDLPPDQLDSIMDGLDAHLAEVVADGQPDLVAALGSPEAYAADLRTAAGIVARFTPDDPARFTWSRRHSALAVAGVVAVGGVALALFAPRPAGVAVVLAIVLAVSVAWWVARLVVERSGLIGAQRGVAGSALAFGAVCAAVVWGAAVADHGSGDNAPGPQVMSSTTIGPYDSLPFPDNPDYTSTMVQVANCSAQNGVARMMTSALQGAGFVLGPPTAGTCDPSLDLSLVIYNEGTPGAQAVAATLAGTLGLSYGAATLPIPVETGVWADGSGVVLLLGNDLAGKTLEQIRSAGFATTTTGLVEFPAPQTLLFTVPLDDLGGYAEAQDVNGQVCLVVSLPSGQSGGCLDVDTIESGNGWSAVHLGSASLLYGLAPRDHDFSVQVAGTTVAPDANGFWYTVLPQGTSEFTIVLDGEEMPITLPSPPMTTTTTIVMQP
ncbi:MAG TPA: LytR C-terminal domain-containing protein [Ilumatobacteraceae bacterium]|nr:LytR C-terminal domain-containing protein [Ilumatobacteraceae bacterium]